MARRDCEHEECPYKYCQHNKYWDGTEYDRIDWMNKIHIVSPEEDCGYCMAYMDI